MSSVILTTARSCPHTPRRESSTGNRPSISLALRDMSGWRSHTTLPMTLSAVTLSLSHRMICSVSVSRSSSSSTSRVRTCSAGGGRRGGERGGRGLVL